MKNGIPKRSKHIRLLRLKAIIFSNKGMLGLNSIIINNANALG